MPGTVVSMNRHCIQSVNAEKIDLQQFTAFELLQRCMGSREELAWLVFLSKIRPFLAAIVINAIRHCRLPDSCLAEDMVQNALLKLCANDFKVLRELECFHEGSLFGFLKAVAFNVVHDYFRSACCQKRGNGKAEENIENIRPTCNQTRDFD